VGETPSDYRKRHGQGEAVTAAAGDAARR
jgi:hypothetical protein